MRRSLTLLVALAACNVRKVDFTPVSGGNAGPGDAGVLDGGGDVAAHCAQLGYPSQPTLRTGRLPSQLAYGDLNNDGVADLVVASSGDNTLRAWLGAPDGSYSLVGDFAVNATGPRDVLLADMNGDGKLDAISLNSGGSISLLLGSGDGKLQLDSLTGTGPQPAGFAVGDLDGDGDLDIAVAQPSGTLLVINNAGTGRPSGVDFYDVPSASAGVVIADFDHDARLDVAVSSNNSAGVFSVLYGLPTGKLATRVDFGMSANGEKAIVAGDVNGDQRADLVIALAASNQVAVLLSTGRGFLPPAFVKPSETSVTATIGLGDLDGDGDLDLITTYAGHLAVMPNPGNGAFEQARIMPGAGNPIQEQVADLDHDGKLDVALLDGTGRFAVIVPGAGNGGLEVHAGYAVNSSPFGAALRDLDGDGVLDAVVGSAVGSLGVLIGSRDGTFAPEVRWPQPTKPQAVEVADMNGDGNLDVIASSTTGGPILVVAGDGHGGLGAAIASPPVSATLGGKLSIADLDEDGRPDIVAPGLSDKPILLRGTGDGHLAPFGDPPTIANAGAIAVADLDGDGHVDLIAGSTLVTVRFGRGDGTFPDQLDSPTLAAVLGLAVADVNGDGAPDVIAATPNLVYVLLRTGARQLGEPTSYPIGSGGPVAAADLDHDGHLDLAIGNSNDGTLSVLMNRGDGTFGLDRAYLTSSGMYNVVPGDVDHDGFPDLVMASAGFSELDVLRARCPTP